MAKTLSNSGITTNDTIRAGHVTQSIDALTGTDAYDITISGSLTSTGNLINTGGYALFVRSSSIPNSVLNVRQEGSGSIAEFGGSEIADQEQIVFNLGGHITASGNVSSSAVSTASFGTYLGDGSQLTGINGGIFAQTGSVQATTNDLEITGSIYVSDTGYSYFGRPDKSNEFFIFPSNGTAFIGTNTPTTLTLTANLVNKLVINDATTGGGHITASAFIIPNQDNNKDLGSPTKRWANIYGTTISGSFIGDGSQLTNLQRPISNSVSTNVTASNLNSGYYFRTGGNITCSIQSNAIVSCDVGSEFEFFQTSSAGNLLFHTGSGVTLNSKNGSTKLSNQFSAATLKKIDTNEWDLIGDLS